MAEGTKMIANFCKVKLSYSARTLLSSRSKLSSPIESRTVTGRPLPIFSAILLTRQKPRLGQIILLTVAMEGNETIIKKWKFISTLRIVYHSKSIHKDNCPPTKTNRARHIMARLINSQGISTHPNEILHFSICSIVNKLLLSCDILTSSYLSCDKYC